MNNSNLKFASGTNLIFVSNGLLNPHRKDEKW